MTTEITNTKNIFITEHYEGEQRGIFFRNIIQKLYISFFDESYQEESSLNKLNFIERIINKQILKEVPELMDDGN